VEFPITNIVRNVPRLPNSSTNNWGGQSTWTHPYWPQPAHSHRQHSPTRAQLKGSSCSSAIPSSTRGMSFRAQLKGYIPSSTQGTQQSYLWGITKSLVDHPTKSNNLGLTATTSPSGGHVPLGATTSRPPGGGHVPPGAKRLKIISNSTTTTWHKLPHRRADATP